MNKEHLSQSSIDTKFKEYFDVSFENFIFKNMEFMSSIYSQYKNGKTLSDKQKNSAINVILGYEIKQLVTDSIFMYYNVSKNGSKPKVTITGKIKSIRNIVVQNPFSHYDEERIDIELISNDNNFINFSSSNSVFFDLKENDTITVDGTYYKISSNGILYINRVKLVKKS